MQPIKHANQVGATLQARRKALELSQTEVAERLGLSQNRLSELERAPQTLTVDQLLALINLLGLELHIQEKSASTNKVEW
ncbi:MAG TPA: helix-turn-helix transcriptional regulator [Steroidobacteraceae bacterium]|nr:helix-turn-helix transcriptional regulator [Steroidobacteraceae bacterium]